MHLLRLYLAFSKVNFLTQMEYRTQYFLRMVTKTVAWLTGFILISVLLYRFRAISGWSTYEVLFLYTLDVLSYSLAATFFLSPFQNLSRNIRLGMFDEVLTKPVNPLLYYMCTKTSAGYVNNYIISVVVLGLCFKNLQIKLTVAKLIALVIVLLGATLIQSAAFMLTNIPAFWLVKSNSLYRLFFSNITGFLQYPLSIYNRSVQIILTFILPYAFVNYYPAQYFLGKEEYLFHPLFQYLTPLVGVLFFTLAYFLWKLGINNYQSTGS